jgi:hypothetical protein
MQCPKCHLENTPTAEICDCGYLFGSINALFSEAVRKGTHTNSLRVIDVSKIARPVFFLKWIITMTWVFAVYGAVTFSIGAVRSTGPASRFALLLIAGACYYIARIAWRDRDVLPAARDKRFLFCLLSELIIGLFGGLPVLIVPSAGGLVLAFYLSRLRLPELGLEVSVLLERSFLDPGDPDEVLPAGNRKGGILFLFLEIFTLAFASVLDGAVSGMVWSLGMSSLLWSRQYFEPKFETVITNDRRRPVLLLRSFSDEKRGKRGRLDTSLWNFFDISLESRLARHFVGVGPFIAVEDPRERGSVLHLGAVRVSLSNNDWQAKIVGWIRTSAVVLGIAGMSDWFGWELQKVINLGRATKLLLVFPEFLGRPWQRDTGRGYRFVQVCKPFKDTILEPGLAAIRDASIVRCLVFEPGGRVTVVTSRQRWRDCYQLAAVLGHWLILTWQNTVTS